MAFDENGRWVEQTRQESPESKIYRETQLKGSSHTYVIVKKGEDPIKALRRFNRLVDKAGVLDGMRFRGGGGMGISYETNSAKNQRKKKKREYLGPINEIHRQYEEGILTEAQVRGGGHRLPGELSPKQKKKKKRNAKNLERGRYNHF
jgi:ribosomal protein S21